MILVNEKEVNIYVFRALDYIRDNDKLFDIFKGIMVDNELLIHSLNVAKLSTQLAIALGVDNATIFNICLGGLLHDVGKLEIPKNILYKPDRLTAEEYEIVKNHTSLGFDLLKDTGVDKDVVIIALRHHENKQGTGYPLGITDIEPYVEIITVADILSALVENRTYHQAKSITQALNYMSSFDNVNNNLLVKLAELIRD